MIEAVSEDAPYRVTFRNDVLSTSADAPREKGGGGTAFGPHELLEAALATCMVMTVRMMARRESWPLRAATAKVSLDRSQPGEARYDCELDVVGELTAEQRDRLLAAASECPVGQTLGRRPILRSRGAKI